MLVVGVAAIIAVFSVVPLPASLREFGPFGVLPVGSYVHFLAYAGLAASLASALADRTRSDGAVLSAVFVVAVGYGVALELVQLTLAHRHFSRRDILVNAAGTTLAVAAWRYLFGRARRGRVERSATPEP